MNFTSNFTYDDFFRRLGDALEESFDRQDMALMKKLEHRLFQQLPLEHRTLFLHYVDAARRQLLRGEGSAYSKGYVMGVEAGGILARHRHKMELD